MGIKDAVNDVKNAVNDATREKNINAKDPDVNHKVQSDRVPPNITKAVDADGNVQPVGNPDGGVPASRFLDKHRKDPPTH